MYTSKWKMISRPVFWWFLTLVWCIFIFYQSAKTGVDSDKLSMDFVRLFNIFLESIAGHGKIAVTDHLIRKTAHFTEYMILGILLFRALIFHTRFKPALCIAYMAGTFYAATDEFHQSFIPGRGPGILDVLIDSAGVLAGILVASLILRQMNVKKENKLA